jgi:hypothetical protein
VILYLDTSALVKLYVEEPGTGRSSSAWSVPEPSSPPA